MEAPDAFPTIEFENIDEFLLEMEQHDKMISAGVMIVGDAAAYGPVWEWGNTRQKKPGPKTVIGTNPAGEQVWLSSQAPFGYIWRNEPYMHMIVDDVLAELEFNQPSAAAITKEIERGAKKISKAIAQIVSDDAPVDKGHLRKSIVPVDPGDTILDQETDDERLLDLTEDEDE